jgi:GTP-binding protein
VITIDDPSLSMTIGINTSPLAGREGTQLTARLVKNRLDAELVGNVSIRVLPTDRPDTWEVQGRGELQLAVLVEMMRREGFELTVGKPQVLTREVDGVVHEPVDRVTIDVPDEFMGVITQLLAMRKGRMEQIVNHGSGWIRLDYLVPARGLIGFRTELMTETRGTALLHHVFDRYEPWAGSGDDRRRERSRRRHGRQPHEGEEAHQHPLVDGGELREADPAAPDLAGAGSRVHLRG